MNTITNNLLAWLILLTIGIYIICRVFDKGGKTW